MKYAGLLIVGAITFSNGIKSMEKALEVDLFDCELENNGIISEPSNKRDKILYTPLIGYNFENFLSVVWKADYLKLKKILKEIPIEEKQFHVLIKNAIDNCLLAHLDEQMNWDRYKVLKKLLTTAGCAYREKWGQMLFHYFLKNFYLNTLADYPISNTFKHVAIELMSSPFGTDLKQDYYTYGLLSKWTQGFCRRYKYLDRQEILCLLRELEKLLLP